MKRSPESDIKDCILTYFAHQSGLTRVEVGSSLADVVNDFELEPEAVVEKYFPDVKEHFYIRRSLLNGYKRYEDNGGDIQRHAREYFWRDVLANLLHQNEWAKKYYNKWYKVVAGNGLADVSNSQKGWETFEVPSILTTLKEHAPDAFKMLVGEIGGRDTVENRLELVEIGLRQVQSIGKKIHESGKVPVTRIMFFNDNKAKDQFQTAMVGQQQFVNRHSNNLPRFTLDDVAQHTDVPVNYSPLSSWTHIPTSESWRYGLNHLGRANALMFVSEIDLNESVWLRNLMEGSTWEYPEIVTWYKDLNYSADPVKDPSSEYLVKLESQGKKSALVANEGEVVVWGKLPVRGIVDLGI